MLPALRRRREIQESPRSLFRDVGTLWSDLDRWIGDWGWPEALTEDGLTAAYPVDIIEDDDKIYVDAEMPGFKKEDIEVSTDNGMLHINAERKSEKREGKARVHERRYQRAERYFTLPTGVDDTKAVAKFEDGVLHLELPKTSEAKTRRIAVS